MAYARNNARDRAPFISSRAQRIAAHNLRNIFAPWRAQRVCARNNAWRTALLRNA